MTGEFAASSLPDRPDTQDRTGPATDDNGGCPAHLHFSTHFRKPDRRWLDPGGDANFAMLTGL
jgi:hypothetical protein